MNALVQPAVAVLLVEVGVQVGLHAGRADLQHPRRRVQALLQLGHALDVLRKKLQGGSHVHENSLHKRVKPENFTQGMRRA
jgi:hypothetical protein